MENKEFEDIDFETALSQFNEDTPFCRDIQELAYNQDYTYEEKIDILKKKYPGVLDGPTSIFEPRTKEAKIARLKMAEESLSETSYHSFDELINSLAEEFPWLKEEFPPSGS